MSKEKENIEKQEPSSKLAVCSLVIAIITLIITAINFVLSLTK